MGDAERPPQACQRRGGGAAQLEVHLLCAAVDTRWRRWRAAVVLAVSASCLCLQLKDQDFKTLVFWFFCPFEIFF